MTLLMNAVLAQDVERVRHLLATKFNNPELVNQLFEERSALHLAVRSPEIKITLMLIAAGADVNIKGKGNVTPLHLASARGKLDSLQILLAANANPDALMHPNHTPLIMAALNNHPDIVLALIGSNANINKRTVTGTNALLASKCDSDKSLQVMQILLHMGSSMTVTDKSCVEPLIKAAKLGHLNTFKLLLIYSKNLAQLRQLVSETIELNNHKHLRHPFNQFLSDHESCRTTWRQQIEKSTINLLIKTNNLLLASSKRIQQAKKELQARHAKSPTSKTVTKNVVKPLLKTPQLRRIPAIKSQRMAQQHIYRPTTYTIKRPEIEECTQLLCAIESHRPTATLRPTNKAIAQRQLQQDYTAFTSQQTALATLEAEIARLKLAGVDVNTARINKLQAQHDVVAEQVGILFNQFLREQTRLQAIEAFSGDPRLADFYSALQNLLGNVVIGYKAAASGMMQIQSSEVGGHFENAAEASTSDIAASAFKSGAKKLGKALGKNADKIISTASQGITLLGHSFEILPGVGALLKGAGKVAGMVAERRAMNRCIQLSEQITMPIFLAASQQLAFQLTQQFKAQLLSLPLPSEEKSSMARKCWPETL